MKKTLVLGIGNKLLSDEGAGLHVLNALHRHHPAARNVVYLDGGTLSFTLAAAVEDADNLIVLDAAQLKSNPGAVACMVNEEMDNFLGNCKRSVHEVGLLDLLDICRLTGALPEKRALVGIQPQSIDWGEELTEPVQQAVPKAMQYVIDLLNQWHPAEMEAVQ